MDATREPKERGWGMTNHRNGDIADGRGRIPLSRRNFLTGAGAIALGAASAGMIAGCSPQESGGGAGGPPER